MVKSKKISAAASSKLGAAEGTNRDKDILVGVGDRLDKSQQSNRTQTSKLHLVPVTKRKFQKTSGLSPDSGSKVSTVYNLRSKVQITEGSPSYNLRSKAQKTDNQNAPTNSQKRKTPKKDGSKDSSVAIQKRGISKISAQPNKKIESSKPLNAFMADLDKKHPLSTQHEPFVCEPFYRIRWEGDDAENGPLGQKCIICNKDLSGATEDDDDDSEYNDDFHYEDDYYDDDDDEYYDDINPPLLPAVDILSCGHAYHTECLQKDTPEERSSDPQCVLCSKKA